MLYSALGVMLPASARGATHQNDFADTASDARLLDQRRPDISERADMA